MLISLCRGLSRRIIWYGKTIIIYLLRLFPIQNNKILVVNYFGKGFGDNAKYICEKLIEAPQPLVIVWAVNNPEEEFPEGIKKVKYNSFRYFYELCTAKVWIDNCRKDIYIRKRRGQFYIQTWHGDIAIKKMEKDAASSLYSSYITSAKNDSKMADLFVAGNEWIEKIYRDSMWYTGKIEKCGYPRRDILYNISDEKKTSIRRSLNIQDNQKIVLYAPTFRKKQTDPDLSVYTIAWDSVLDSIKKRFGGEWIALVRLHPNISKYSSLLQLGNNAIDVSDYPDMQELMAISDICISDYSSSIIEFAVTGKPGFIFAVDYSEYKKDRGVYFELEELPFPISSDNQQLIDIILGFDKEKYDRLCKIFFEEQIRLYPSGNASECIANIILQRCKEDRHQRNKDV